MGLRQVVGEDERFMNIESIVSLAVSALLLVYLAFALLRPEKF